MSTMFNRTNKTNYKRHEYSGPRKSLKKVCAGLRRFYGETSRPKVWRSAEMKKKPMNKEIVSVATDNSIVTQNTQLKTYARLKSKIHLEACYIAPCTSTVTAEPVVGQSTFVEVAQYESEIEALVVKLEPPEYYESGLLGESGVKIEKIEIGEEGFS